MYMGKQYPIRGTGSPLTARETLLVAMLRLLGYPLIPGDKQANYQDTIKPDQSRVFCFIFDGGVEQQQKFVREVADEIRQGRHEFSAIYEAFEPGTAPKRALAALGDRFSSMGVWPALLNYYGQLLDLVAEMPRHLEIRRGSRTYWMPSTLTAEEIEAEIKKLNSL